MEKNRSVGIVAVVIFTISYGLFYSLWLFKNDFIFFRIMYPIIFMLLSIFVFYLNNWARRGLIIYNILWLIFGLIASVIHFSPGLEYEVNKLSLIEYFLFIFFPLLIPTIYLTRPKVKDQFKKQALQT